MRNKKVVIKRNYLEKIPVRNPDIKWDTDQKGLIALKIENKGWANRIAQKLFRRPKMSYIHLDENGSLIWPLIDGERDIIKIGEMVDEHFGEKAHPLYERLAQFMKILESYKFITFK